MKKAFERRIVLTGMAAVFILVVVLVVGIAVMTYRQQEKMNDEFAAALLEESEKPEQTPPPNWFGYRFTRSSSPAGYYVIETEASGSIESIERVGMLQNEDENIETLTAQILQSGKTEGKIGAYKYRTVSRDGLTRIVLTDQTAQMNALYNVLRTGALVGAVGLLALLVILLPMARYVSGAWMRKTERQKQFITNAGHELKTPVAIIMSNAEALELIGGESKYSRNILEQSTRLDRMIQQLLMMARVDEARFRDAAETVDLSTLLTDDLHAIDVLMCSRGMTISRQIADGCLLRGYRESLRQMVHVLMDNAVSYGSQDGCIHVTLEHMTRRVQLTITNTTDELPSCKPGQLFERFYRADKTHAHGSGCGVGLSAAKSVAELHHGSITVTYPDERTFCVTVNLPVRG